MDAHIYELLNSIPDTYWRYVARHDLFSRLWRRYRGRLIGGGAYDVLDVGCGSGGLLAALRDREPVGSVRCFGADLYLPALGHCGARGIRGAAAGDATALPFRGEAFDLVVSQDVLEHIPDDAAALAEAYRVCKPGGLALLLVPAFQSVWSTRDIRLHHCRRYRLPQLADRIGRVGFRPVHQTYTDCFLLPPLWLAVKLARRDSEGRADIAVDAPGGTGLLNRLLTHWSGVESLIARKIGLPFGVSALVLARKPG